ncbi:MAG TPA: hypothetical protein VHF87_09745 [Methylomirabilota bacterium]|jgi:hypothetical protein|nr:hypothetical protein [Methylomirabilota bacterium]
MKRQRRIAQSSAVTVVLTLMLLGGGLGTARAQAEPQFTTQFPLDECTFSNTGRNLYFSIRPGDWLLFKGDEDGETVRVLISVLNETKTIRFKDEEGEPLSVNARVVEEREWKDGELVEVSRNYYARCEETNDIYYFGEAVDIYEDGEVVSHEGAWLAGRDTEEGKARPGLIMPGSFLLGARYAQEQAAPVALDRAEHVSMGLTVETPAGTFEECVQITETSPLEPGAESIKLYCAEVGLVADGVTRLIRFQVADFDE